MEFWKKEKEEKIYNCVNKKEYFAYRNVAFKKYQREDNVDELRNILFIKTMRCRMLESLISSNNSFKIGLQCTVVASVFALISLMIDIGFMHAIFYILLLSIFFVPLSDHIMNRQTKTRKQISMIQTEIKVLEELIEEKSKPHKFYNEFF